MTEPNRPNDQGSRPPDGEDHPSQRTLEELLDGELGGRERDRVATHVADCEVCRREVEEIEALGRRARELPRSVEPSRDLWPGIEARILAGASRTGASGPAVDARTRGPGTRADSGTGGGAEGRARARWFGRGPLAGLAAAAAVAAVAGTMILLGDGPAEVADRPPEQADRPTNVLVAEAREVESAYEPTLQELRQLVDDRDLSPETREVLEESLTVIDQAIREAHEALEADPGSPRALDGLRRMYDAKVDVLRTVAKAGSRT